MTETVFHFCAMSQVDQNRTCYSDGCVRVPEGGTLDMDALRADTAQAIAKTAGLQPENLRVTLLSVTRLAP